MAEVCPVCGGTGLLIGDREAVRCPCGCEPRQEGGYVVIPIIPPRDSLWWKGREDRMPEQWRREDGGADRG